MNRKRHIFISYVEEDTKIVQQIANGLEKKNHKVWYYERDGEPGTDIQEEIEKEIRSSKAVVVIISDNVFASPGYIVSELSIANTKRKKIIPVLCNMNFEDFQRKAPGALIGQLGNKAPISISSGGVSQEVVDRIINALPKDRSSLMLKICLFLILAITMFVASRNLKKKTITAHEISETDKILFALGISIGTNNGRVLLPLPNEKVEVFVWPIKELLNGIGYDRADTFTNTLESIMSNWQQNYMNTEIAESAVRKLVEIEKPIGNFILQKYGPKGGAVYTLGLGIMPILRIVWGYDLMDRLKEFGELKCREESILFTFHTILGQRLQKTFRDLSKVKFLPANLRVWAGVVNNANLHKKEEREEVKRKITKIANAFGIDLSIDLPSTLDFRPKVEVDSFEYGGLSFWSIQDKSHPCWRIENEKLVGKGFGSVVTKKNEWHDYEFKMECRIIKYNNQNGEVSIIIRANTWPEDTKGYVLSLHSKNLIFGRVLYGANKFKNAFTAPLSIRLGEWLKLRVKAEKENIYFYVNDALIGIIHDSTCLSGCIGFGVADAHVEFRNVRILPIKRAETMDIKQNEEEIFLQILRFKTRDGRNLLEALYGFKFDPNNPLHLRILKNISKQIKKPGNEYGVALDIDRLELVYNKAPLVCRNLADLEIMLQNQLEIYECGRSLIIQLFGLRQNATFADDALLRQLVVDYESKIRTEFRTKGIRLNLKTNQVEEVELTFRNVQQIIELIRMTLKLNEKMGTQPGPFDYYLRLKYLDPAFFPTGGYNIL